MKVRMFIESMLNKFIAVMVICALLGGLLFFTLAVGAIFSDNATIKLTNNSMKRLTHD